MGTGVSRKRIDTGQKNCFFLSLPCLMGLSGLEPPTSRLSGVRSNHLSYAPNFGGDEEDRTPDPLLAGQVLSQLSYTPIFFQDSCAYFHRNLQN